MNKRTFFLFLSMLVIIAGIPALAQGNVNNTSKDQANSPILEKGCPFPMISLEPTGLSETGAILCQNGCCLPCPIANNFYKEKEIDLIYQVICAIRVISFICILIIVISYIILPNKREHPALTVLCFNMSLLIFLGVTFFYIGDIRKVQCADSVTQSTMKNNTLCGVQGIVLIFSTFLLILYCFILILHLHLQSVWRSNIIQQYFITSQILVMIIAITFTILPATMGKISFEFGAVCLVSSEFQNELFWYPLAIFVIPGFLIHLWTFIHIGKSHLMVSIDYYDDDSTLVTEGNTSFPMSSRQLASVTGQEIVRVIKIQWRALMLALTFLVTYIVYWTYITVELDKLQPPNLAKPWFLIWLNCIFENGMKNMDAQNICSVHARDHIPNIVYLTFAEVLTASLGISIFIIFGTSIDLWSEWRLYFLKKFGGVSKSSVGQA